MQTHIATVTWRHGTRSRHCVC